MDLPRIKQRHKRALYALHNHPHDYVDLDVIDASQIKDIEYLIKHKYVIKTKGPMICVIGNDIDNMFSDNDQQYYALTKMGKRSIEDILSKESDKSTFSRILSEYKGEVIVARAIPITAVLGIIGIIGYYGESIYEFVKGLV